MRAVGGEDSFAWILPRGARSTLPDFDPRKTSAALGRAYVITAALAVVAGALGLAALSALRSRFA
jgi:hypothetical protein